MSLMTGNLWIRR